MGMGKTRTDELKKKHDFSSNTFLLKDFAHCLYHIMDMRSLASLLTEKKKRPKMMA